MMISATSRLCSLCVRCHTLPSAKFSQDVTKMQRPETIMTVFDRNAKLLQRERAAQVRIFIRCCFPVNSFLFLSFQNDNVDDFDYLKEEIGYRLADRVLDIKRRMEVGVDIGSGRGFVTRHLTKHSIKKLYAVEMSPTYLGQCHLPEKDEVRSLSF